METPEIRIAAFEWSPVRGWVVDGMQVCTYVGFAGNLNGYVRLPVGHPDLLLAEAAEMLPGTPFTWPDGREGMNYERGYDYVDVDCPGGWTYGPDLEGWIGFDTNHAYDHWSPEDRLRFVRDERDRRAAEFAIVMERDFPCGSLPGDRLWTEELVERAVEKAARELAARARVASS